MNYTAAVATAAAAAVFGCTILPAPGTTVTESCKYSLVNFKRFINYVEYLCYIFATLSSNNGVGEKYRFIHIVSGPSSHYTLYLAPTSSPSFPRPWPRYRTRTCPITLCQAIGDVTRSHGLLCAISVHYFFYFFYFVVLFYTSVFILSFVGRGSGVCNKTHEYCPHNSAGTI